MNPEEEDKGPCDHRDPGRKEDCFQSRKIRREVPSTEPGRLFRKVTPFCGLIKEAHRIIPELRGTFGHGLISRKYLVPFDSMLLPALSLAVKIL